MKKKRHKLNYKGKELSILTVDGNINKFDLDEWDIVSNNEDEIVLIRGEEYMFYERMNVISFHVSVKSKNQLKEV